MSDVENYMLHFVRISRRNGNNFRICSTDYIKRIFNHSPETVLIRYVYLHTDVPATTESRPTIFPRTFILSSLLNGKKDKDSANYYYFRAQSYLFKN